MVDKKNEQVMKKIGNAESTTVEWKKSLSVFHEIMETVSAFSNTEGGKIYVGVSDEGHVLGVQIGKGTMEDLVNKIGQHTDPKVFPKITIQKINGKDVIVIDVKESRDHLVLADGLPYKRVGRTSPKMSKDEYEHRIFEKYKDKLQFDEMVCKGASLKDIDSDKVFRFLERAKEEKRLVVPDKATLNDALMRLNLFRGSKLVNTAILLFGKDPQRFFVQAKIRAARFKGVEGHDYIDMKVLEGTIPELREKALAFIAEHSRHAVFFDANQRFDKWEYPVRALEEVLNNALAHRDYWSNSDIHLAIYDDRIEVWNPGKLPESITLAQLKRKHLSVPRNRFLAERLFYIKYIEHWGRGTNRIVEAMRESKLADPIFEELTGGLNVILVGPGKAFEKAIDNEKLNKIDLNDRQKRALDYVKEKGTVSRKQYAQMTGISLRQANDDINDLISKRVFRRIGSGSLIRYELAS